MRKRGQKGNKAFKNRWFVLQRLERPSIEQEEGGAGGDGKGEAEEGGGEAGGGKKVRLAYVVACAVCGMYARRGAACAVCMCGEVRRARCIVHVCSMCFRAMYSRCVCLRPRSTNRMLSVFLPPSISPDVRVRTRVWRLPCPACLPCVAKSKKVLAGARLLYFVSDEASTKGDGGAKGLIDVCRVEGIGRLVSVHY